MPRVLKAVKEILTEECIFEGDLAVLSLRSLQDWNPASYSGRDDGPLRDREVTEHFRQLE